MRKKKIVYVLLSILLLGALGLLSLWVIKINTKVYTDIRETKFKSIQLFDNNKFVLVAVDEKNNRADIYYGQNYVSTIAVHSWRIGEVKNSPPIGKEEYYKIISYDLNSPNLSRKELDLYELPRIQTQKFRLNEVLSSYYGNGKDYMARDNLYQYVNGEYFEQSFLLDIDNEELFFKDVAQRRNEMATKDPYRNKVSLTPGGLGDSLSAQLREYHLLQLRGAIIPDLDSDNKIDISNTNFAQLYPEVAKNMKDMTQLYFRPE
ncbi:Uncharacterised protein [Streptococcus sanguinis]|uniref:Uncharacterized protein n=1 Tax=Streptococcus sanguinis TaxID=1305 RepID=A0A2X3YFY3_STRSA|nr:Uncharacterised protein [Streptococcus sanguinis]